MPNVIDFIPPGLVDFLKRLGFAGNRFDYGFESWDAASRKASGYDQGRILQKVLDSSLKVRNGEAAYERDGVLFDRIQYSWPLLAGLLSAPRINDHLRVLDWGGALGSTYRQNRTFLVSSGISLSWTVIEQADFVEAGNRHFASQELNFQKDLDCFEQGEFDVALFASSLCYVANPYSVLGRIAAFKPARIVIDRTPETHGEHDLFGIQTVGRKIYKASYPITSFGRGRLKKFLEESYDLVESWTCDLQPDPLTTAKGYIFAIRPEGGFR